MKNMNWSRGGGGGRGGAMFGGPRAISRSLRTIEKSMSRAKKGGVSANPHDPFSSSSRLSHNSSKHPFSFSPTLSFTRKPPNWCSSSEGDDSEWVCLDEAESFLGPPPSQEEIDYAVSTLQLYRVPGLVSDDQTTDIDWVEPSISSYNSTTLQANGFDRLYYAFHLLKTDPHVQRMVKSLSADKIVWDAVLNNEVVQELREATSAGEEPDDSESPNESDSTSASTNVFMAIFDTTKTIFMEVIERITNIANELFHVAYHRTHANGEGLDSFHEKLRTSFYLSIMVMMFVVLNRAQGRAWYN